MNSVRSGDLSEILKPEDLISSFQGFVMHYCGETDWLNEKIFSEKVYVRSRGCNQFQGSCLSKLSGKQSFRSKETLSMRPSLVPRSFQSEVVIHKPCANKRSYCSRVSLKPTMKAYKYEETVFKTAKTYESTFKTSKSCFVTNNEVAPLQQIDKAFSSSLYLARGSRCFNFITNFELNHIYYEKD